MLDWERRAIQLGPCDEPRILQSLALFYDPRGDLTGTAWWPNAFFASEIWRRWGVGLVVGSLNLWPVDNTTNADLPGISLALSEDVARLVGKDAPLIRRWSHVRITPVLVSGEALGFVIRATGQPPTANMLEVFAPTHLRTRLGIPKNHKTPVGIGVLACDY